MIVQIEIVKAIVAIILSIIIVQVGFAQRNVPQKILFVGNSYTYYWNLPQQVSQMAQSQGVTMQSNQSTTGGSNLGHHYRSDRGLTSMTMIKNGGYQAVVLQDQSMRAIQYPDSLDYYGGLLGKIIKSSGATPYLYMTWSRAWDPYTQKTIEKAYSKLARDIGGVLVPVGLAWARSIELRPDLDLYDKDGSHPSSLGTYLSACVFYSTLTGKSAVGLPTRLLGNDDQGEKLYLNIVSPNDALFLQKVATEVTAQ